MLSHQDGGDHADGPGGSGQCPYGRQQVVDCFLHSDIHEVEYSAVYGDALAKFPKLPTDSEFMNWRHDSQCASARFLVTILVGPS